MKPEKLVIGKNYKLRMRVRKPKERWNGPQPILKLALPPWLLRATKGTRRR